MEYCRLHNITLQARGPLAAGRLTGRPHSNDAKHIQEAAKLVMQMATEKGVSPEAILVAWILRHPARIQPLSGTTNPDRIRAAAEAEQVSLTRGKTTLIPQNILRTGQGLFQDIFCFSI
jgi:predicted oxidoreductase